MNLIDASSSISGLRTSAVLLHQGGHTHGIAVEVLPLGARDLFGMPAGELARMTVELDSMAQPRYRGLAERLREREGWADRFDLLDEMLCSQLDRIRVPGKKLARAWDELTQDLAVPIVAVARPCSERRYRC